MVETRRWPRQGCGRRGWWAALAQGMLLAVAPMGQAQVATTQEAEAREPASQPASGTSFLIELESAIAELAERTSPAVVAVRAEQQPAAVERRGGAPVVYGSGSVIRADGMVLTCRHVVEDALAVFVTLADGRRFRARVVAADDRADLAVLQIAARDLAAVEMEDARDVRRGQIVLACGNALGLSADGQSSISLGIVGGIGRPLPASLGGSNDRYYGDMIQTSALVTPGYSGGPLLDVRGRMIGVLAAIGTETAGEAPLAFAIPIGERTLRSIEQMMEGRSPAYGFVGLEVGTLTPLQARAAGAGSGEAVVVESAEAGGSGERAGLAAGDVILAVDGRAVASADEFVRTVGAAEPGCTVKIEFVRDHARRAAEVEVRRRAQRAETPPIAKVDFRGAVLQEIGRAMREQAHWPEKAMLVVFVEAESPAGRAGLSPGDVVVRLDGETITTAALEALAGRDDECLMGLASGASVIVGRQ